MIASFLHGWSLLLHRVPGRCLVLIWRSDSGHGNAMLSPWKSSRKSNMVQGEAPQHTKTGRKRCKEEVGESVMKDATTERSGWWPWVYFQETHHANKCFLGKYFTPSPRQSSPARHSPNFALSAIACDRGASLVNIVR
jgi:hypothetical protein